MRLVSAVLVVLIFACLLLAQAPVGFGPGTTLPSPGILDYFDWYAATASGCTAGAGGMCVGSTPTGDTMYFTGWFADASKLPITTGLPIVGTLNDFHTKNCSGNLAVIQLAEFSWAARNASRIYEVNCMPGFNSGASPTGWAQHCTSNDASPGCVWHSRSAFVRGGLLYLPVIRQIPAGTASVHDSTIIVSADGGKTWKNPYTIFTGGAADAGGDPPLCGAAAGAGNPCTDTAYLDTAHGGAHSSMMWKGLPGAPFNNLLTWQAVQYGQDWGTNSPSTTMPSGVNDGCDPTIYTCFISDPVERSLARVLNTDLPSLDVSKWQYYTCPAITDAYRCPGSAAGSWTSVFADRTPIGPPMVNMVWSNPVTYIKEFKSYLMTAGNIGSVFATAPAIQGPWDWVMSNMGYEWGFATPMLGAGYTVLGTNPPHVQMTVNSDIVVGQPPLGHVSEGSPMFSKWDLVLGRTPMLQGGEQALFRKIFSSTWLPLNAGYVLSDSHAPGTIPRKDIAWMFDFYDHGGNDVTVWNGVVTGFRDLANGSAFLLPCHGGGALCDWNPGQGINLQTFGASITNLGYQSQLVSAMHETPQTIAIGATKVYPGGQTLVNAPAAMQGNGSYTVAGVFRYDGSTSAAAPLWITGDTSGSNTAVALQYTTTGTNLELGWGTAVNNRWRFNSGFSMVAGNWYFIACTVQANGATPVAHMWMGNGGVVVDKIAGVARASTGGTPTQTPNVAATPMSLGMYTGSNGSVNASYAHFSVHGRALGQAEVGLMYQTVKAKMAARGVTLQ
jgi:hypothetical protein